MVAVRCSRLWITYTTYRLTIAFFSSLGITNSASYIQFTPILYLFVILMDTTKLYSTEAIPTYYPHYLSLYVAMYQSTIIDILLDYIIIGYIHQY